MESAIITRVAPDLTARSGQTDVQHHPHFVGLAHLRSLLTHEEVAGSSGRTDVVLDMISVLISGGASRHAVQAFCHVRNECQDVCYLALFRLRRWMESNVLVRVNHGNWESLDLSFRDYKKVVQSYRRKFWEWQDSASPDQGVEVRFAWKDEPAVAACPVASITK